MPACILHARLSHRDIRATTPPRRPAAPPTVLVGADDDDVGGGPVAHVGVRQHADGVLRPAPQVGQPHGVDGRRQADGRRRQRPVGLEQPVRDAVAEHVAVLRVRRRRAPLDRDRARVDGAAAHVLRRGARLCGGAERDTEGGQGGWEDTPSHPQQVAIPRLTTAYSGLR